MEIREKNDRLLWRLGKERKEGEEKRNDIYEGQKSWRRKDKSRDVKILEKRLIIEKKEMKSEGGERNYVEIQL